MNKKCIIQEVVGVDKEIVSIDKNILWNEFKKASNEILETKPEDYCKESKCAFKINDFNREIVFTILRYFAGDENFDKNGIIKNKPSLVKGLFISGEIGVGKSKLFEILSKAGRELIKKHRYARMHFRTVSCISMVSGYMLSSKKDHLDFNIKSFYKGKINFDDLGAEKKAFNSYELMEEVLFERHKGKSLTIITTNLSMSNILERYGSRIADRIPEMCNILVWKGESLRHEK
ncbi:P-loop NTPase family protein [Tenacibaculum caenipelagi]|uniref:DNA replication protein DnaC n=1 Tax=Tenacibaculum caenipelagi TaxID=1325435 RepID=A0A4R6TH90_9FLAO|nr:hypothetical protein [Tenacibaculum caenipelagi]TDQ27672.1 hypothetical protein DFQ07_1523 [Tenacibaculum caenipelagi]